MSLDTTSGTRCCDRVQVEVVAALTAAVGSLLVAVVAALFSVRGQRRMTELQHLLDRQTRQEDRLLAAKEQLDRYREPLLAAARDLEDRIGNIRERAFLSYLTAHDEHRRSVALRSTSYRFAAYWGVVEALNRSVNTLKFEREAETHAVNDLLRRIVRTFSTDGLDGHTLMVWREEQRAIGELMHAADPHDAGIRIIGFSAFVDQYPTSFSSWLSSLEHDLQLTGIERSPRLAELQTLLRQLVDELEEGRSLTV